MIRSGGTRYALGAVVIGLSMAAGSAFGAVLAQAGAIAPAGAGVSALDLVKGLGMLGAAVGVYVALDRRVTRLEVALDAGIQRILDRIDGRGGLVDRVAALEDRDG